MSKRDKRLQRLRRNPKNVSFDELKQVLEDYGFQHVRTAGSHHTFIAIMNERDWRLTVPQHRPVKTPYIKQAIQAIDEIIALKKEEASTEEDELAEEDTDDGDSED
jgi:predicted RNA binding protein YcfA (HicA-like mRNA interferase family)